MTLPRSTTTVVVDRSSVAMGDDAVSHRRTVEVSADATLDELFAAGHPDAHVSRTSWIAHWDGRPFAVWAGEWHRARTWEPGLERVSDLGGDRDPHELWFAYWSDVDPDWLIAQLLGGAALHRPTLSEQWRPLALARRERELRDREASTSERLFDAATVEALTSFGARIDLHTDRMCRFDVGASPARWQVERIDTMTLVRTPSGRCGSLRPADLAEPWIVALVGAEISGRGPEALPDPDVPWSMRRSPNLWSVHVPGQPGTVAQLPDAATASWFARTLGRSVAQVAAAYRE